MSLPSNARGTPPLAAMKRGSSEPLLEAQRTTLGHYVLALTSYGQADRSTTLPAPSCPQVQTRKTGSRIDILTEELAKLQLR